MLLRVDAVEGEIQGEEALCELHSFILELVSLPVDRVVRWTLLYGSAHTSFSVILDATVTALACTVAAC